MGVIAFKNGKIWGFIDIEGKEVVSPKYTAIHYNNILKLFSIIDGNKAFYLYKNGREYKE